MQTREGKPRPADGPIPLAMLLSKLNPTQMTITETKRTWTPDRREEFKMLFELICEARLISKGTNVIQRLQKCVAIADELSRSNFVLPRESFIKFLEEKVCEQIQAE